MARLPSGVIVLIVFPRRAIKEAADWPGRRWLAALDAVAWPGLLAFGILGAFNFTYDRALLLVGVALVWGLVRLRRAVFHTGAYRLTTWWAAKAALGLLVVATVWKAVLLVAG